MTVKTLNTIKLKKKARHQYILSEVNLHNRVLLTDLATLLQVSMDTIRRDLTELHELKKLRKVHGGAVSKSFNNYANTSNEVYEINRKAEIARKGISLLQKGDVVLISGGSTNIELIKLIPAHYELTFFTPSLPIAIELLRQSEKNYKVIFIGGELSPQSQLAVGPSSIQMLSEIKADICFLGTGYLHEHEGVTENDWNIAQMKKAMIKASKKTVTLTISEKLNSINKFKICDVDSIDTLVTELSPDNVLFDKYKKHTIKIL